MNKLTSLLAILLLLLTLSNASAQMDAMEDAGDLLMDAADDYNAIVERPVEYALPTGKTAEAVMFMHENRRGTAPAVLVVPEWWGLNDYAKMRGRELAKRGYVVLVADMYGDGITTGDPAEAQKLAGPANQAGLDKLAKPALDLLKSQAIVKADRIAAIGFCFGGSTVVAMAGSDYGSDLAAVASFHGGLSKDTAPTGDYSGPPMMILHGGADPMVKPDAIAGFTQASLEAGVPLTILNFPDAVHAFTNPNADAKAQEYPQLQGAIAYDEQATEISMMAMHAFFDATLRASE